MSLGNPHHRRLPRDARHVITRIRAIGRTGYVRASVLHAQVAALDYAVNRRENPSRALPADTDMKAPGDRVRLGAEVRDLLARLHASKNLREQQALVREIRHAIMRRIIIHAKRARAVRGALERAGKGARWTRDRIVSGARWARDQHRGRKPGREEVPVRVVGNRKPAERTRQASPARAGRALPSGERIRQAVHRGDRHGHEARAGQSDIDGTIGKGLTSRKSPRGPVHRKITWRGQEAWVLSPA